MTYSKLFVSWPLFGDSIVMYSKILRTTHLASRNEISVIFWVLLWQNDKRNLTLFFVCVPMYKRNKG